ncbi:MAG: hypothetical protein GY795_33570 [Desulfobacterales bacterium]|nr:hypothetical protein [Desulfobacterales bacterium]
MEARYLNVDLVVTSDSDLSTLAAFLEGKVFFLWKEFKSDFNSVGFETNLHNTSGPDEDITELLNLIESLPEELKNAWFSSKKKVMDIGYECGSMDIPINSYISPNIVKRLAQVDCAINIRIYPCV